MDPESNRKRMEALVTKVEALAESLSGKPQAAEAESSPTTRLAAMLKEALAANTIGGKPDDDSRLRAAQEELRQVRRSSRGSASCLKRRGSSSPIASSARHARSATAPARARPWLSGLDGHPPDDLSGFSRRHEAARAFSGEPGSASWSSRPS
jgi:hypothetical protein